MLINQELILSMVNSLGSVLSIWVLPYLFIGLATMLEGPITLLLAGSAVSNGLLQPIPVYLAVICGNLTADLGWYTLGRFVKPDWVNRFIRKWKVYPTQVESVQQDVQRFAPRLLFLSKLSVGFPIPILIATGMNHVPAKRWITSLILGELIKSGVFLCIGYYYTEAIQQVSGDLQIVLWGFTILLFLGGMIWYKRYRRKITG